MRRPRILLVNPWIHDFAAYDLWAKPLGLMVLGSMLRENGWETMLVDCVDPDHPSLRPAGTSAGSRGKFHKTPLEKPEPLKSIPRSFSRYGVDVDEIRKDLEKLERPAAIVVSSLMTYWHTGLAETVELLRNIFEETPIILGGVYASLMPDHARKSIRVDEVLPGPGEFSLNEALFHWTSLDPSRGRNKGDLGFSPDLDLLRSVRFIPLLTSRGCPYRCAYCASRIVQPEYRRRNPVDVISEIEANIGKYKVDEIVLYDDAFLCDADKHALHILGAFASCDPQLKWHTPNGLHVSEINPKVALSMKKAGFRTLRLGLESASDDFHLASGQKTTWSDFVRAVGCLREAGFDRLDVGAYILVGLPGQSRLEIERDVEEALKAGAYPRLAEYSPIPGSTLWSQSVKTSRYPIETEPLFQNCSLLPVAEPEVNWEFLSRTRKMIRESLES
jgi:radical SAM superfamily enzyme YgiQ (UPF0313 family)